jgi:hypothetical protein
MWVCSFPDMWRMGVSEGESLSRRIDASGFCACYFQAFFSRQIRVRWSVLGPALRRLFL